MMTYHQLLQDLDMLAAQLNELGVSSPQPEAPPRNSRPKAPPPTNNHTSKMFIEL